MPRNSAAGTPIDPARPEPLLLPYPTSLPALTAGLRTVHTLSLPKSPLPQPLFAQSPVVTQTLVQAYQIHGRVATQESEMAGHVVQHILERLRRLATAYGEWSSFDASAYFDLTNDQSAHLLRIEERPHTVHCTFFVDLLLPSFQTAVALFERSFAPGYHVRLQDEQTARTFFEECQPQMIAQWQRAQAVIRRARTLLLDRPDFLAMTAVDDERWRWRAAWSQAAAPRIAEQLLPTLQATPSLTLACEFALPAYRQPGRLRRLRRNRLYQKITGQKITGQKMNRHKISGHKINKRKN